MTSAVRGVVPKFKTTVPGKGILRSRVHISGRGRKGRDSDAEDLGVDRSLARPTQTLIRRWSLVVYDYPCYDPR